jgi:RNA polymerase sigma-70 factor (ECF subfamily)
MQTTSCVHGERKSPDSPFGQFAADLIRRKARELCRLSAFQNCDRTDIEQELRLVLVKRLPKFDASIAHFNAFVTTVVERFCASLIEHQTAKSRSPKRNGGSLNQTCTGAEGKVSQAANQIEESHTSNRTGVRMRSKAQLFDLETDVASVIGDLPDEMQDLCERLKHDSVTKVAEDLGLARSTLRYRIEQMRARFDQADMRDYL